MMQMLMHPQRIQTDEVRVKEFILVLKLRISLERRNRFSDLEFGLKMKLIGTRFREGFYSAKNILFSFRVLLRSGKI